ncbi:MAG TPA: elongation factor P [Polyangiaceae bacterium]|jgi:elongation factor P
MDTSDIRKGLKIMMDGQPYVVVDFQFVKPGKGQAFTRTKLKNMLSGGNVEKNIRSGEKLEPADVEDRTLQYIYPDGDSYVFMNSHTGEQITVHKEGVGSEADLLIDGIDVVITVYKGNPVSVTLPPHVVVQIAETEPGAKGDTATNVTKPAKVSSGAIIQVPLFVNEGDWIRVDTRTRSYLERAKAPQG